MSRSICLLLLLAFVRPAAAQDAAALVKQATAAARQGDVKQALQLIDRAVKDDAGHRPAYVFRASLLEATSAEATGAALRQAHESAVRDFTKAIELDPKEPEAYHARGSLRFKLGQIDGSLADFDRFLELRPDRRPSHWQRGITCYYAGKFDEGARQFEGYQDFDANDVENAVWRFLCVARKDGMETARKNILKIGPDKRVPMREIYDLFAGTKKPDDVMAAARAGDPPAAAKNRQLFYAHLYLGLWHDLRGERGPALEHLARAADEHRIGHYMWDVARVHRDRLRDAK